MMNQNSFKILAYLAYFLIFMQGSMICLPFFIWIFSAAFFFGSLSQLFAIAAILGLVISHKTWKKPKSISKTLLNLLTFILLLSPVLYRMIAVPIEMFNYLGFIVPFSAFVILYSVAICLPQRKKT